MGGWRTWLAIAGAVGLAINAVAEGNYELAMQQIVIAIGLLGIGTKIENNADK